MENSKKPSTLKLTSADNFLNETEPFEIEMLQWPIVGQTGWGSKDHHLNKDEQSIYRAMLEACTMLEPFSITVSIQPVTNEKVLRILTNVHARIYLDGNHVLDLDHYRNDTRNKPYNSILDWIEMSQGYDSIRRHLVSWSVEDWRNFFRKRLKDQIVFLKSKAKKKRKDITLLEKSASDIAVSLAVIS